MAVLPVWQNACAQVLFFTALAMLRQGPFVKAMVRGRLGNRVRTCNTGYKGSAPVVCVTLAVQCAWETVGRVRRALVACV